MYLSLDIFFQEASTKTLNLKNVLHPNMQCGVDWDIFRRIYYQGLIYRFSILENLFKNIC